MKISPALRKQDGFTLVELAIVFLIIAVLAAFALPQYQEYVRQGRRAEAMATLMDAAQKLERYYSAHGSYLDGDELAAVFQTAVPASGTSYYDIAPAAADTATFKLVATATGVMQGDKCGDFVINQAGAQSNENTADGVTSLQCWRR